MLILLILTIVGVHNTVGLEITPIPGPYNNLTDSSFWLVETQSFYWSDYWTFGNQSSIFRYDVNKQKVFAAYIPGKTETAYLVPVAQCGKHFAFNNDLFLSGSLHENYLIRWNGVDTKATIIDTIFRIEGDNPNSHMDLGAQNARGKFFVGTTNNVYCLGDANRSIYSYTKASGVELLYTGFKSTAGLVFDGNKIYHNDVCRQKIEVLERDASGNYVSKLVFDFTTSTPPILPSGLEIDDRGLLYTTGYGSGTVWQVNPRTGTAVIIATLPSKYLTAVGFGGPFRDILFVVASSALFNANLDVVDFSPAPPLYKLTGLGARGVHSPKMYC